jgi:hypothetical protein
MLSVVPNFEELYADPALAAALPVHTLKALLLRTTALQNTIVAALMVNDQQAEIVAAPDKDRMLTTEEAASMLRCSRKWIYRHADDLPFVMRKSRKSLLCSEAGIKHWLQRRRS